MPTTSRRAWLSVALVALVPWWHRPTATAEAQPEGIREYDYMPSEVGGVWFYTYDQRGRLTSCHYFGPLQPLKPIRRLE